MNTFCDTISHSAINRSPLPLLPLLRIRGIELNVVAITIQLQLFHRIQKLPSEWWITLVFIILKLATNLHDVCHR